MGNSRILAVSRRRFVQGLAGGAAIAGLDWAGLQAFAEIDHRAPATLSGTHFDLAIDYLPVNFTGRHSVATAVNGSVPGPTLRWREGDQVTVAVTNRLKTSTSIHWHGVRVPAEMDGVPGLSFRGILPNETFVYRIPVLQSGTYWYHSHSRLQEQTGLMGALIVERQEKETIEFDREYVVLLTDWTDGNPATIFSNLKEESEYYNYHQRTAGTFFSDAKKNGWRATISNRLMWGRMNMTPTDISDVTASVYTYLLNGNSPGANWTGLFQPGERVRLRFINGSAMTIFDVRIPGLAMTVVQSDGNDVEPVTVDEFRMGVAETYDVIVQPHGNAAYTIFAQSQDRSGYARGTLAPAAGMTAAIPPMDPRPMRTMMDMGMGGMAGMKMAGMDGVKEMDMPANGKSAPEQQGMKAGMDMGDSPDASMPGMSNQDANSSLHGMAGMLMGSATGRTPFPQPGPRAMPPHGAANTETRFKPSKPIDMHLGPQVDQISMKVKGRLGDPGDGLSGNGRRVLTYADLRGRYRGVDNRPPTREIELHISGNMERYIWGFNGEKFSNAKPIELKLGERVRFVLINDTMMDHPIHLHGLWSELENGHGEFNPYKHTIIIKPSERVSYLVSADTPGRWAFHCHLMYHMEAGMFRTVVVSA
jgi:CopA family copper-resistance protein